MPEQANTYLTNDSAKTLVRNLNRIQLQNIQVLWQDDDTL